MNIKNTIKILCLSLMIYSHCKAEDIASGWIGFAGNYDMAYRKTQFFEDNHNVGVGLWDNRIELWLPPHTSSEHGLAWGPYFRMAGIASTSNEAWENGWLALPGVGFQIYPFSYTGFNDTGKELQKIFGPLRLIFEYNWLHYWGSENSWRPDHQIRTGAEYWRAQNVNDIKEYWWAELWSGVYYVTANEFDPKYDTTNFGFATRTGLRIPKNEEQPAIISMFTPYLALESAVNKNQAYYWDNRLMIGGGIRFTPTLDFIPHNSKQWLNRFIIYAEYDYIAAYYRDHPPSSVPNYDVRVGINFSLGDWFPDYYKN